MTIVTNEMLALTDNEKKAIEIVLHICNGVDSHANNPDLRHFASEVFDNLRNIQMHFVDND